MAAGGPALTWGNMCSEKKRVLGAKHEFERRVAWAPGLKARSKELQRRGVYSRLSPCRVSIVCSAATCMALRTCGPNPTDSQPMRQVSECSEPYVMLPMPHALRPTPSTLPARGLWIEAVELRLQAPSRRCMRRKNDQLQDAASKHPHPHRTHALQARKQHEHTRLKPPRVRPTTPRKRFPSCHSNITVSLLE
jgi:hypothetical protein